MKKHKNRDIIILFLYVDDLIIKGNNNEFTSDFMKKMMQEFEMTDIKKVYAREL